MRLGGVAQSFAKLCKQKVAKLVKRSWSSLKNSAKWRLRHRLVELPQKICSFPEGGYRDGLGELFWGLSTLL
jgi:hypothetical protein